MCRDDINIYCPALHSSKLVLISILFLVPFTSFKHHLLLENLHSVNDFLWVAKVNIYFLDMIVSLEIEVSLRGIRAQFETQIIEIYKYSLFSDEILGLCDSFCLATREFYFDRSPRIFENILGLYRKGELHLTESVCPKDFVGELEYWGLSSLYLEPCCAYTLQRASWLLPVVDHGTSKDQNVKFDFICLKMDNM